MLLTPLELYHFLLTRALLESTAGTVTSASVQLTASAMTGAAAGVMLAAVTPCAVDLTQSFQDRAA
jgi:hypothetical protein